MTLRTLTADDVLERVIAARNRFAEDAAYWRRSGLGVAEIRRAIAYEMLALDLDDVVGNLRRERAGGDLKTTLAPNADDLPNLRS